MGESSVSYSDYLLYLALAVQGLRWPVSPAALQGLLWGKKPNKGKAEFNVYFL